MKKYFKLFITSAIISFFLPLLALADGKVTFETASKTVAPGGEILITAVFEPGDATVNAISGDIEVSSPLLIKQVIDARSFLTLWIEAPHISADNRRISFAGIVPGGLSSKGNLFQFILSASGIGTGKINASEIQALNQGQNPTPIHVSITPISITVAGKASTSTVSFNDNTPPDEFKIYVQSDANVFDGKPFVAFSTHDKQTGIAGYVAAFSYLFKPGEDANWQKVQSPYEIPAEGMGKLIWIKAIDTSGNETLEHAGGPGYNRNLTILAIIIGILLLCIAYYVRHRHGSLRRSSYSPDIH